MAKGINSYIRKKDEEKIKMINYCQYCKSKKDLCIDHILSPSKDGNSKLNNLARCCINCNTSKSDKTIFEFYNHIYKRKLIAQKELRYCNSILRSILNKSYQNEQEVY